MAISQEELLLRANIIIFFIFTHLYWIYYKFDKDSFVNKDLRYIDFYSIAAQTHVGGPSNMNNSLSIISGIIHLFFVLYVNIFELAHEDKSNVLKILTMTK